MKKDFFLSFADPLEKLTQLSNLEESTSSINLLCREIVEEAWSWTQWENLNYNVEGIVIQWFY